MKFTRIKLWVYFSAYLNPWCPQTLFRWCIRAFLPKGCEPGRKLKIRQRELPCNHFMNIKISHISLQRMSLDDIRNRNQCWGKHLYGSLDKEIEKRAAPCSDVEQILSHQWTATRRRVHNLPRIGPEIDCLRQRVDRFAQNSSVIVRREAACWRTTRLEDEISVLSFVLKTFVQRPCW